MHLDQQMSSDSPDTYSDAEFHYFLCEAIPASPEMKRSPRYGHPAVALGGGDPQNHETPESSRK